MNKSTDEEIEVVEVYIFLAAYKRQLGEQMEIIETKMGRLETQIGLTHRGAMELRTDGMDLLKRAEDI